jgi:Na+/glutamate symporter
MSWIEELRHDIAAVKQTESDLRKFGVMVGGIIVLLSASAYWQSWWRVDVVLIIGAAGWLLVSAGALVPLRLKGVHKYWMAFAVLLGSIVSRIILFILFFLIVTPLSILAKVFGKKFFVSHKETARTSYWITRGKEKPINYERMY